MTAAIALVWLLAAATMAQPSYLTTRVVRDLRRQRRQCRKPRRQAAASAGRRRSGGDRRGKARLSESGFPIVQRGHGGSFGRTRPEFRCRTIRYNLNLSFCGFANAVAKLGRNKSLKIAIGAPRTTHDRHNDRHHDRHSDKQRHPCTDLSGGDAVCKIGLPARRHAARLAMRNARKQILCMLAIPLSDRQGWAGCRPSPASDCTEMSITHGRQLMRCIGLPEIGFLPAPVMANPHLP